MAAPTPDLARCVAAYAARLHAATGSRHQVASALGAWLLLALAAPASSGADRELLTEVLGCDADTAAGYAAGLLARPHPVVASAAAVWTRAGFPLSEHFRRWRDELPPAVASGDLPPQAELDAWARGHTLGLIDRFPIDSGDAWLVLASALATKVSWEMPFTLAPATALGRTSAWPRTLQRVLRTPNPERSLGHRQFIVSDAVAGDVAVHAAAAQHGLLVYSVAAAPDVPFLDVLAAAHRIGCADAISGSGATVQRRELRSLPLGDGPAWVIREEAARSAADVCTAVLPAWSARSQHDLGRPDLGFGAAASALAPGDDWTAAQAAMAKYSRTGFEAAAVTVLAALAARAEPRAVRRVAELRFGHPYAVVAVAVRDSADDDAEASAAAWHGLPVFSAWVTEPEDATDDQQPGESAARPL
jgi:hypothetical protein